LTLADKTVLVIGGGPAGLAAALELSGFGVRVEMVEKAPFLGGNAAGYACKATDRCVKCGACMVAERIAAVGADPGVRVMKGSRVHTVRRDDRFHIEVARDPMFINPERCSGCGKCLAVCPAPGAIVSGFSGHDTPPVNLHKEICLYFEDGSCTRCRDVCPEGAIDFEKRPAELKCSADAIILATGFSAFTPDRKPYGYGRFADVVTNLQLEQMLRTSHHIQRPSSGRPPRRLAFIQCVGSRDDTLGHLWCSKVCCASALRMARVILSRQPETDITFFYIDVQTFGRDFEALYAKLRDIVRMKRAIPADIILTDDAQLEITYFDNDAAEGVQELFDMAVLSVGMTPRSAAAELATTLGLSLADTGFVAPAAPSGATAAGGIFTAGSALGPMSIAESIADAGRAAWRTVTYLSEQQ
jgi:heterodisulfide reductase subunit A